MILLADVQKATHERARRHHNRPRPQSYTECGLDALHGIACRVEDETRGVALVQVEPLLRLADCLKPELVRLLVALRARPAHARSFRRVEHAALDGSGVRVEAHRAAERIDLADHVAFC